MHKLNPQKSKIQTNWVVTKYDVLSYGALVFLSAQPSVCASLDTHEHVCGSHPWGYIDLSR